MIKSSDIKILLALILFTSYFAFNCISNVQALEQSVLINEIFPNPVGTDLDYEWIELYNTSSNPIEITNWKIQTAGTTFTNSFTISSIQIIQPKTYFLLCENLVLNCDYYTSRIAMQNGGTETDGVRIIDSQDNIIDTILYDSPNNNLLPSDINSSTNEFELSQVPNPGESLARYNNVDKNLGADFIIPKIPTPGRENSNPNKLSILEFSPYKGYLEIKIEENLSNINFNIKIDETIYPVTETTYPLFIFNFSPIFKESCIEILGYDGSIIDRVCQKPFSIQYSSCRIDLDNSIQMCKFSPGESNEIYKPTEIALISNTEDSNFINQYFNIEACIITLDEIQIVYDSSGGNRVTNQSQNSQIEDGCYILEVKKEIEGIYINQIYSKSEKMPNPISTIKTNAEWDYINVDCKLSFYEQNLSTYQLICKDKIISLISKSTINSINLKVKGFLIPFSTNTIGETKYILKHEDIESIAETNKYLANAGDKNTILIVFTSAILFIIFLVSVTLQNNLFNFKHFIYGEKES